MTVRLPNAVGASKIELAKWAEISKSRRTLEELIPPERVGELTDTRDKGPVLPFVPPLTKQEFPHVHPAGQRISKLFTYTTKMAAFSFALAAGPIKNKGTCPVSDMSEKASAKRSQDAESDGGFADAGFAKAHGKRGPKGEKSIAASKVRGLFICDACYAGKATYKMYKNVHVAHYAHLVWVNRALARGSFVDEMTGALQSLLSNNRVLKAAGASSKHFRIHDSGDLFSIPYMMAWFEVCARLPDVAFWVPTRQWVIPAFRKAMAQKPANLAVRPSALFYGSNAPMLPGLSAGSASAPGELPNHWECPAYLGEAEKSCAAVGCRTCWDRQEVPVNYRTH